MKFRYQALSLAVFLLPGVGIAMAEPTDVTRSASVTADIEVPLGHNVPVQAATRFTKIAVADDQTVTVTPMSDTEFLVRGKEAGSTNIIIYNDAHLVQVVNVRVTQDVAMILADLEALFPEQEFRLRRVNDHLYVEGEVEDSVMESRVLSVLQSYSADVINALTVKSPGQVALQVRFLEASREDIKQIGLGNIISRPGDFAFMTTSSLVSGLSPKTSGTLYGGSGGVQIDVLIDALEEKGIVKTLASPTLVSSSGETASFLAGGEFPIPVAAEFDRLTIEFREFGVGLEFQPEVLGNDRVNLRVKPEVSQVDSRNSITLSGFEIPSLIVRKADTSIELRDGQTFAIAGLLQNSYDNDVSQTPLLGDIPVLGALFRSTRFRESETELIILVTPRLLNSGDEPDYVETLMTTVTEPSEAELFFLGLVSGDRDLSADTAGGTTE